MPLSRIQSYSNSLSDDTRWTALLPSAPTSVTTTAGNTQVTVSWTAPAVSILAVTDYIVQYSSNSGSTWTTFSRSSSTSTSVIVTGLSSGTAYVFRVAAINSIGQSNWSITSASATPTSAVSLLLHFDGTNGSTTFTDSSANALVPTLVGSPTISTTQGKFNQSGYFNGSSYLSYAANSSLFGFGAGDFTIEMWAYFVNLGTQTNLFTTSGFSSQFSAFITTAGQIGFWNGSSSYLFGSTGAVSTGTWTHLAWSRQNGSMQVFANGTQVGTTTSIPTTLVDTLSVQFPANTNYNSSPVYLDEMLITKGIARYTNNFTPSTTPFSNS
jgi:Fibronectin type III domain/Concanavalin A-like lectin/glucanases superfamily